MKFCIVIPCYNHVSTVGAVAEAARAHGPVLIVDDGSSLPLPELPGCAVLRLERNGGKAAALRAGFKRAADEGFTHAITMDADGQHSASDLPGLIEAARIQPEAFITGQRDFVAAGAPAGRRRSNAVSSFWFRVETGVRLTDTQCGFRCYPLALTQRVKARSGRFAYELEMMVRIAWIGSPVVGLPVRCVYQPDQLRQSHFRPVADLSHITIMNIGLVLQSWIVPRRVRAAWSLGEKKRLWSTLKEFFVENADDPFRLSLAVGLGLFFGIAPLWGFQMLAAATTAHFLRLNKAIALLASNISIPPMMPFILYGALALGHWMFTAQKLDLSPGQMTRARAMEYLWQWAVGSFVLAAIVAAGGTLVTYFVGRLLRRA